MPASKFDEISPVILAAIEEGNSQSNAARLAGLPDRTYWDWVKRGKDAKSGKYRQFVDGVEAAMARGQKKLIDHIRATGSEGLFHEETRTEESSNGTKITKVKKRVVDWHAAAWLLERIDPESWGPPRTESKIEMTGEDKNQAARLKSLGDRFKAEAESDEDEIGELDEDE